MKQQKHTIQQRQVIPAAVMIFSLLWLTVSLPFVDTAKTQIAISLAEESGEEPANNDNNPFANTTEEKTSGGNNTLSEEFLHETQYLHKHSECTVNHNKCNHPALYIAFHGELFCPPPNTVS